MALSFSELGAIDERAVRSGSNELATERKMFEGLEIRVPAMRGKMGSRTYYSLLMPMSGVPQFFKFTNWSGISPEDREQRVLNEKESLISLATLPIMRMIISFRPLRRPTKASPNSSLLLKVQMLGC